METSKLKAFTYRVEGIPRGTNPVQLKKNFFYTEDQDDITVKSLCPSVESVEGEEEKDLTATVFFRPRVARPSGPRVQDKNIEIDKDFTGFTPLYVPPAGKGPIAADIIAVTGLAGHAYGSWAHSDDRMWLRDYLKDYAPNARILTYGYVSELQNGPFSILHDHTARFVNALITMREDAQCQQRPIIFIGHSLGCLIIKKALIDTGSIGVNASRLPVRTILFLAAPHKGINVTALQTLVKKRPSETIIAELQSGSPTLVDLNDRFARIAQGIDIHTFFETRETQTVQQNPDGTWTRNGPAVTMVDRDSASLYFLGENRFSAFADHSQIAKIKKGQSGIFPQVKSAIQNALIPTVHIVAKDYPGPSGEYSHHGASQGTPPPMYSPNNGTPFYTATSFSQSNLGLQSRWPGEIPQRVSTPLQTTGGPLPRQPTTVPSNVPSSAPESTSTTTPDLVGTPSVASEDLLASLQAPYEAMEDISGRTSPSESFRSEASGASAEDHISRSTSSLKTYDFSPIQRQLSSEPALSVDDATESVLSDIASTVLSNSSKESSFDTGLSETCKICHEKVWGHGPHYRCLKCFRSDEDEWYCCSSCFEETSDCPDHKTAMKRFTIIECFRFHHYLPFVDDQVSNFDTAIVKAVKQDDAKALQLAIRNKRLLKACGDDGSTPLHLAAQLGRERCVEILLRAEAPKEARDAFHDTPLMNAVNYNHLAVIRILLEHFVDIDDSDQGRTALSCAVENGQSDIVSLLLEHKAKIEVEHGPALLVKAASKGDEKTVELLLDAGAKMDMKEEESGDSALITAASKGHEQIVKLLLSRHAEVNAVNDDNETPLLKCCEDGNASIARILLEAGADVNISNFWDETPLHKAVKNGHLDGVNMLLERGAEVDAATDEDLTPLHIAAIEGEEEICQRLLDSEADMDAKKTSNGETALLLAFSNDHYGIVKMLLNHGADANSQDDDGYTCLHWAAKQGNLEICETLVNHRADLEITTSTRSTDAAMTSLHLAAKYNHGSVVELLLRHDANVDSTDWDDYTSLHRAAELGFSKVCESLLEWKASTDEETEDNKTPLYLAIDNGHSDVVKVLLENGADPNERSGGIVPLYRAARLGDMDSLGFLVANDANLDMENNSGVNAVSGAAYEGHIEVIKFLLENGASGAPPSDYSGKWKHQTFSDDVSYAKQREILKVLREAKHK